MIGRNDLCYCGSGKKYKKCHMLKDEKKPKNPPERLNVRNDLVKTNDQVEGMRNSGAFNGQLMDYIRQFVRSGISTEEIDSLVHKYTIEHGHTPACLGYRGFPKSLCTSINNVVCHGIPSPDEVLKDGDIVNIDLTSIVNGYFGDSSETFMIGDVSSKARHLVDVTANALIRGIDAVKPGVPLIAIAEAIEPFVKSQGCSVVKTYTGHGIGQKFHEAFTVYHHVEKDCEPIVLKPGMTFTIEPMINLGGYEVITDRKDKWTVRTKDGSLSAQFEHTILVTDDGAEVLTLTPSQKKAGVRLHAAGVDYK
ncbi:methionyl aminopeptidase [Chitinispirillales bacterium ANBcel5]|uniref:methionyl aminopeptidase n=1 Tax=Cellulosispirillum alkaliphilum TaxID=3039283 RepID=UPI002A50874C|nr:methionyl aminopeptidase [Chitinispirillales bacterium ANBcel5]